MISISKRWDIISDNCSAPPLPAVRAVFTAALKLHTDLISNWMTNSWVGYSNLFCYIVHLVQLSSTVRPNGNASCRRELQWNTQTTWLLTSKCPTPHLILSFFKRIYSFDLVFESFLGFFFLRKQNVRMEKFCCSIDRVPGSILAGTLRSVLVSGGEYTPEIITSYFAPILILLPLSIFLVVPLHTIPALLLLSCTTSTPHLSIQVKHQFQAPSWTLDTLLQNWKPSNLLGTGRTDACQEEWKLSCQKKPLNLYQLQ